MKFSSALVVASAASATAQRQQVLKQLPEQLQSASKGWVDSWVDSFHEVEDALRGLTDESRKIWDDVANMFPDQMSKTSFFTPPKKHTRRPDSHWDHIVRGKEIHDSWVYTAAGNKERELSGKLDTYDMRVKKVDPSELGVDPNVTQYSGYLDDKENDKHLFYCKLVSMHRVSPQKLLMANLQGSSSLATIPQTTLLYCGSTAARDALP